VTGDAQLILIAGALLVAGVAASLVAVRLRVPALVLFMGLGMAIGTDGAGWIDFSDYELARLIGSIALALILFEGGLATGFGEIRPVLRPALSLAFLGTFITAAITGFAAAWLFDLSVKEGLLLGAILAATDGAAVFSLLRGSKLRKKLAHTLEGEAGFNDPVAVLLVLVLIELIKTPDYDAVDAILFFCRQLAIGAAVGIGAGWLAVRALQYRPSAAAGLNLMTSLATVAVAFGLAGTLHGSGFLAAYIAGLIFGNSQLEAKRGIRAFHYGLASIGEITMFLAFGLLVFPSQLGDIVVKGTVLALVIAFVARPLAAFLATAFDDFDWHERLLVGWAGLRGAVPVVLATFPVIEGIPRSVEFFNIAFFAVLLSTTLQGATVEALARFLKLTEPEKPPPPEAALSRAA
jgi:cell volume regulation protein A